MGVKLKYLTLVQFPGTSFLHREVQAVHDFWVDVHALLFLKWEREKGFAVETRVVLLHFCSTENSHLLGKTE